MRRLVVIGMSVVSGLTLAACYGSTEPATNIGEDAATLNARGTANNGPATSYIEYWTDGDPLPGQGRPRTPTRSWPAGVSGPISEQVSDLLVASQYSFRLCGHDQGAEPVCAQTRTFPMPTPAGDYVKGSFGGLSPLIASQYTVRFNARSGPNGENSRGTVKFTFAGSTTTGIVRCLQVNDIFARIGVVFNDGSARLYRLSDVREEAASWGTAPSTNPPNCATSAAFENPAYNQYSFVLHDAP